MSNARRRRRFGGGSARVRHVLGAVALVVGMTPATAHASISAAGVQTTLDASTPFLYLSTFAGSQVWTIAHHGNVSLTAPKVSCVNRTTGGFCTAPDGITPTTWPKALNTTAGALTTGNTSNLATTEEVQYVRGATPNILYYPAVTTTAVSGFPNGSVGAGCIDLQTQRNCTYVPLAALTNTAGASNVRGLTGFVQVGTNAYGTLTTGKEVCFVPGTGTACLGQPYNTNTPPDNDASGTTPNDYTGTTTVVNGLIYTSSMGVVPVTTAPHKPVVTCWDPATTAPCVSWSPQTISEANAHLTLDIFPLENLTGVPTGVCAVTGSTTTAAPILHCWDLVTATVITPPANLTSLFPSGSAQSQLFQSDTESVVGNVRTYFPMYSQDGTRKGTTLCYSWTNGAPCGSFPINHTTVNGGDSHDYGYVFGADTGCMYGGGHTGFLFSFSATTGAAGC